MRGETNMIMSINPKAAIEDFTTVIELNPDYAEAYFKRGDIYWRIGWSLFNEMRKSYLEKALKDWEYTIDLNSKYRSELKSKIDMIKKEVEKINLKMQQEWQLLYNPKINSGCNKQCEKTGRRSEDEEVNSITTAIDRECLIYRQTESYSKYVKDFELSNLKLQEY